MSRADLVVRGRIATLAGRSGLGWVDAIAIGDGRVLAAGSRDEIDAVAGPTTRRLDLAPDEAALPGLTDAHIHLAEGGLSADRLDLTGAATLDDGVRLIAQAAAGLEGDAWLEGHGWNPDRWGAWPTADDLERAAPGHRIALWAHDHHSLLASRAALATAGIGEGTLDPPGGVIRRGDGGRPTGVLHEAAARLVTGRIPPPTADRLESAVEPIARDLVRLGVVAAHDPGALSLQEGLGPAFGAWRRLAERGGFPIRVHACVREEQLDAALEAGLRSGDPLGGDGRVRFGWLKLFGDGTLGSRTAALLAPFEPEPGRPLPPGTEGGLFITPPERLAELARRAADAGIGTLIHAIGDRAVRAALDALEPVAGRVPLVPRLEHVQLADPADQPRFGRAGIAASVQPVHLRSDAASARRLWGERAEAYGYPWRSLLRAGALLTFGTDAPVESIDPWPGLAMAITRRDPGWPDGTAAFGPAEGIGLDDALRAACLGPAVSAGEGDRGRLVAGHRADLVVVPAAALGEPVEPGGPLSTTRPRLVLIDGRAAFEA